MNYAVLGSFLGDEGKGQTTHNKCKEIDAGLVVRFSGGPQSGHTVRVKQDVGYIEHVFSNFGSGTLLDIPTYWAETCAVNPTAAMIEYEDLKKLGHTPVAIYDPKCEVVLPHDRIVQITDKANLMHGTVGTGYKKCLDRVKAGYHLTVMDCLNLNVLRCKVMSILLNYYNDLNSTDISVNIDQWCTDAYDYFNSMSICNASRIKKERKPIVFEGSQGILLDQTYSIMPYCTPSNTTCENISKLYDKYITPVYVTRPYITRHGAGPIPSTMEVIRVDDDNNQYNDFQKTMRAVKFDVSLFRHCMAINSCTYPYLSKPLIAVTHIDEYPDFRLDIKGCDTRYFFYEDCMTQ